MVFIRIEISIWEYLNLLKAAVARGI